jgi:hypothetical protein
MSCNCLLVGTPNLLVGAPDSPNVLKGRNGTFMPLCKVKRQRSCAVT